MPHCVIECSAQIAHFTDRIVAVAHASMIDSGLFAAQDIKTRSYVANNYVIGDEPHVSQNDGHGFIHVVVYLLSGRTAEQKNALTQHMGTALTQLNTHASSITVDIRDVERTTYYKWSANKQ